MCASFLHVFVVAQCLSLAIGSPLDSLFDPLPSLGGTVTLLDNPAILTADIAGPEDPIFFDPGGIELVSDPSISSFPETDPSLISFDGGVGGALGGADFFLAATNECGTRERACCLRGEVDCYTAPSSQCSNKPILCCDRVDAVTRAGINCQPSRQVPQQQPPSPQPQNTQGDPLEPSDEEYFNFLFGLN